MKQCPACKTTYTDETLKFCLADGAALAVMPDSEKTVAMSFDNKTPPMNVPPDSVPTIFPAAVSNKTSKKGVSPMIVAVLGLLLLLVVVGFIGFASYIWLIKPGDNQNLTAAASPTPTVSQTPGSSGETAELKEKLANLEKQVAAQNNRKTTNPGETFSTPKNPEKTARVNSPGDGFLALRSEPNSETGERLAKIPHGAMITVLGCPKKSNSGKISGRWCQVVYNGQAGWAFSAYMIF